MRVVRDDTMSGVTFVIQDVDPDLDNAVQAFGFQPIAGGYRQTYPERHPDIDDIFQRFAAHFEEMLIQKARLAPIPWVDALNALCETIDGQDVAWWLTGSAALAVRGMAIVPGDIDLVVGAESADRFEALLRNLIVEPPRPGWISDTFTRAFHHTCIEWIAGIDNRADAHMIGDVGPTAASRLETVVWQGHAVRVPPLDLQLAVNEARGLTDRVAWIRAALGATAAP